MSIPDERPFYPSTYTHQGRLEYDWWASNGPTGGYLTALAVDLAARRPAAQAPRIVDLRILRLPKAAPYESAVSVHPGAARLEVMSSLLYQHALFAVASVYSTPPLEAPRIPATQPPAALPPPAYPVKNMPAKTSPPVTGRFEYRPIPPVRSSSSADADLVWVRHRKPVSGRSGVAEAIDCWYPALMMNAVNQFLRGDISHLSEPPATNLLSVHTLFPSPDEAYGMDGHLLLASRLVAATEGHSFEATEVWSERGELLAVSQLVRREEAAPLRADVS